MALEEWQNYANTMVSDNGSVVHKDGKVVVTRTVTYRDEWTEEAYEAMKAADREGFRRYMESR